MQIKRGYKKRAQKVKPAAAMAAVAEKSTVNKSPTKTVPTQLKENKLISESADLESITAYRGIKVEWHLEKKINKEFANHYCLLLVEC